MIKNVTPNLTRIAVIAAALLSLSGAVAQQARPPRPMVLEGGTLIDGTGRAPITDAIIVVEGTRIKAVGKRGQVPIPANATIIKTDGRTILPGLIDSHTHTQDFYIPMFLHYGVTTIQDKNNDPGWIFAEREALRKGEMKGPRLFAAGQEIFGILTPMRAFNSHPATNVAEAVADAHNRIAAGADIVNIGNTVTNEQLAAVIGVAKDAGLPVTGHVQNIRAAAALGHKYQEHMFSMGSAILDPEQKTGIGLGMGPPGVPPESLVNPKKFPELIQYMVAHGVFVNPTLAAQWSAVTPAGRQFVTDQQKLVNDPDLAFVPAGIRQGWNDFPEGPRLGYANVAEFLKEYVAAGGKVVVGTDTSHHTIAGLSLHYEMKMLADAGIPPMNVIEGATLWNAQLIFQDKDIGSVEPGKIADFVIIEGDPLADITATRNIRLVIKDGAVVDTRYDPKWVNPIPGAGGVMYGNPEITKVTPAILRQGSGTVTLRIDGSAFSARSGDFRPNSILRFDTVDLPTHFESNTALTATLDAGLLRRSPGLYPLYVVTPGLHGTVSAAAYLAIDSADAPVPAMPLSYRDYANQQSRFFGPTPRSARQGGQGVQLTIEGTKFAPNAVVRFDNVDLPTHYVSATKMMATLDTSLLQRSPGSYVVYVVNPGVYGNVSEAGYFLIDLKQ